MEWYFFEPDRVQRLYNCSFYDVNAIPLDERTHPLMGISWIIMFCFFESLYLPCLWAMRKLLAKPCYKFMFYVGCADVVALWINALLAGYFAMVGAVFCSYPTLQYWTGSICITLWIAESTGAVLLAFSRCLEVLSPKLAAKLMKGNRSLVWLIPPTLLAAYVGLFTPPASYNGKFFSYGFNPHLGYISELAPPEYTNTIHSIHNVFLFVSLTGLYLVFCIVMMIKYAAFGQSTIKNIRHKWNFLQVALISAVNATAAAVYVFAIYWHVNAFIIIVGHYCWILAHGMPCVIYMTMNHTIREQFRQMLLGFMPKSGRVSTMASSGALSRASDLPPRDGADN